MGLIQELFYGLRRIGYSMLRPAPPDLIYSVRRLTRLNAKRVISGVLQHNGNGITPSLADRNTGRSSLRNRIPNPRMVKSQLQALKKESRVDVQSVIPAGKTSRDPKEKKEFLAP